MRSVRHTKALALTAGGAVLVALLGALAAPAFQPPRTAVVDRSAVFRDYAKTRDRESEMQAKLKEVKATLEDLKTRLEALEIELQQLKRESDAYDKKMLEQIELKLQLRKLQETEYKALMQTRNSFLKEISDEIGEEISAFARAHDVDLVLERQVRAEGERGETLFEWPIVHYVKPELDITAEITRRLNERYKSP